MISLEARAVIAYCRQADTYLQKSIRFVGSSSRTEITFFLEPSGERVPPRVARAAILSGYFRARDVGLFDDIRLAQSWSYRRRPAEGGEHVR
jgi:hypothetical protein